MQVSETVLLFVVIPLAILVVVGGLAYAGGERRGGSRYRPGRPFEFTPVWFLAAPERLGERASRSAEALPAGRAPAALGAGERQAAVPQGATGGASDRW